MLARALAAGWYELRGRLTAEADMRPLAGVYVRYTGDSTLGDAEVMLPAPAADGRIRVLLLFLDEVASLEFAPGVPDAHARMHDASLRRVSRFKALWSLSGGSSGAGRVARLSAWARRVRRRGLKKATDALYADYRRCTWPRGISEYAAWVRKYDTLDAAALDAFRQRARVLHDRGPLVSVLLVAQDASAASLRRCLDGLLAQAWERWEAWVTCVDPELATILDDYASRDPHIQVIRNARDCDRDVAFDAALARARGEFIVPMGTDCGLRPHALLQVSEAVASDSGLDVLYADEDRIDDEGKRSDPEFNPDWNPDLLRSRNYLGGCVAMRTALARASGGFRTGFEGSGIYDLVLRCSERAAPGNVHHLPAILCHRFVDSASPARTRDVAAAELRAVATHLERLGNGALVENIDEQAALRRIRWPAPQPAPKISLIIPTRDRGKFLQVCVESLLAKTTYPDFELVVVDNQSRERAALRYLERLSARARVRVLRYDAPFNYSAINNWAARQCDGLLLGFVNNDIEVIAPDWLEEMAGLALRPDTGAVGAMLYYPDDTIQHAGMVLGVNGVAGHIYAGRPRGDHGYLERTRIAQNVSAVTGACLLVRRKLFDDVGGFDEGLPVEFNDVDFCLRLQQRGYRNVWTPFAELYHHESASRVVADAGAKRAREAGIARMRERWGDLLRDDPAYNPNLSLHDLDCRLAFPPRVRNRAARGMGYDGAWLDASVPPP
ncbi:MAG: glycosyltransferase family 2 protein [Proteobacteria bacterium]|nr:glycosyltransferase family 2 protein [Pseudomonadota bacterium]